MKNLSDEKLVTLFTQGRNEAFDELLLRYKSKLYSYIYMIVQNRELTEDIFQDTFTKVIVTLKSGRYTEVGRFSGFLFRIAHNRIIDNCRREQTNPNIGEVDVDYDLFNNAELAEPSFEDMLNSEQVRRDIRRMIKFLPAPQRKIIIQRYYLDMSFKDIAEREGISINTALGRVRYAILNMRRMAEQHQISLVV